MSDYTIAVVLALPACGGSSGGGSHSGSGMSDSAYCKELDDLWFQSGASQTLMEVTSDNQYGGPIGLDPGKLRDAASKASKLAADAPAGATGEGKSVKDHFNEAAPELNAATSGQPGKMGVDDEPVVAWQAAHCN